MSFAIIVSTLVDDVEAVLFYRAEHAAVFCISVPFLHCFVIVNNVMRTKMNTELPYISVLQFFKMSVTSHKIPLLEHSRNYP